MAQVLVIDDDPVIRKIIATILVRQGHQVVAASDGKEGLAAVEAQKPDVAIIDVMMPGIDGYEVTRRLRQDPDLIHLPILILTGRSELQEKLNAFEAGADDYMSKPFEPAELIARLSKLLRWGEAVRAAQTPGAALAEGAWLLAVHSLRGGTGCSSMAVNLALGLTALWERPILLLDMVPAAGQVALMLNAPPRRTWADLMGYQPDELDIEMVQRVITRHDSGLDFVAAPTYPEEGEGLSGEGMKVTLDLLRSRYEYIVVDLPHDFGDVSLQVLDAADVMVLMLAPEMGSVRAASAALTTYGKLGYRDEKIRLVMNWIFERKGLAQSAVEDALRFPISLVLPFAPDTFVSAINLGRPLLLHEPEGQISALIEDFSFGQSRERHRTVPPAAPSPAWQRVNKRLLASRKAKRK